MNTEQMVAELFDIFDVNNAGVISRGEFVGLAECQQHEKGVNFSTERFKQYHAKHDNEITKEEKIDHVIEQAK